MNKKQKAIEFHDKGYNCAQAVACAFCEDAGMDLTTAFRITEGLGFGGGCAQGTCGALTGATIILGLKSSSARLDAPNSKAATYKLSRELMESFKKKNSSVICKELKGMETGTMLRSCPGCIEDAVEVLEEIIKR